ncbi:MAG: hypothetical protein V1900_02280 [Candidatus Aenigmatarchaeota archaeon]
MTKPKKCPRCGSIMIEGSEGAGFWVCENSKCIYTLREKKI